MTNKTVKKLNIDPNQYHSLPDGVFLDIGCKVTLHPLRVLLIFVKLCLMVYQHMLEYA